MGDGWEAAAELEFSAQFPLHAACKSGSVELLRSRLQSHYQHLLLEDPMDCLTVINQVESLFDHPLTRSLQTPLHLACFAGQFMTAKWLLQRGAVIGKEMQRHESCVEALQRNSSSNEAASSCESLLLPPGVQQTLKRCHDNGSFDPVVAKRPRCSDEWRLLEAEQQAEAGPAPLRTYQQVASCSISGWHFM
uniref:ANK_REP_REGION domain-containing protein n=1 Tax=Macrostomum lignano TaxID=282301 RepID=A0A1I8IFL1_9PLAT